jgi:hypothetical protein
MHLRPKYTLAMLTLSQNIWNLQAALPLHQIRSQKSINTLPTIRRSYIRKSSHGVARCCHGDYLLILFSCARSIEFSFFNDSTSLLSSSTSALARSRLLAEPLIKFNYPFGLFLFLRESFGAKSQLQKLNARFVLGLVGKFQ